MDIQKPGEANPLKEDLAITDAETALKELPDDDLKSVTGGLNSKPSETLVTPPVCVSQL